MAGGVLINQAGYSITNTVIANNGNPSGPVGCGGWSGACILNLNAPAGGRRVFLNDTVLNSPPGSGSAGVVCDGAYPLSASVVTGQLVAVSTCMLAPCCGAANLNIDPATYHLTAGSSCIGKVAAGISTPYDLDGQARPLTTVSDCGADEYTP
jgi:hypothetical protein